MRSSQHGFIKRLTCLYLIMGSSFVVTNNCHADIPPQTSIHGISTEALPNWLNDDPLGDFLSVTIPLKRAGRLFLIEATIDGQIGNLVFDTGATGLVLNKTYFRKYTGYEKPPAGGSIMGAFDKVLRVPIKRVDIAGLYYENINADLADLGHIENRRGVKIIGLFGLNMIDNFEVIFDARNNQLHLLRIDRQGNRLETRPSEFRFEFTQKVEYRNNIMLIQGKVGEKMLSFCLDTGAETNVIDSHLPKKVMSTIQVNRRSTLQGAGAGNIEVLYGTMNEFRFGEKHFGIMETIITSLEKMSEAYGCTIDGMLGYDFWSKGVFCINFGKSTISFSLWKGDAQ